MKIKELNRLFINNFSEIEQIGNGGNATVYAVKQIDEDKIIALKVLNSICENFEEKRDRFIIEKTKVVEIQNDIKGIIPIIDSQLPDSSNDLYWYTMPIAQPIDKHFGENRIILDIVKCIISLASTLSILHDKDIVHRDIKPANLYFYGGDFCLSDFGLVDYPDKKDITRTDEQIGAKATIAPEMKRDSRNSDGKKADVYSLSKTLWMLLTKSTFGFEGIYHPVSNEMGLGNFFRNEHLVELNQLLVDSTQDEPSLRPTMLEFLQRLTQFTVIYEDFEKSNLSEWNYVMNTLFKEPSPNSAFWQNINSIMSVLNTISYMPNINHLFFPNGGGLDLHDSTLSKYENCIELNCSGFINIVSPNRLIVENIDDDPSWSYFRLELNELEKSGVFGDSCYPDCEEELIELNKNNFIHPSYWPYRHYNEIPFPEGTRKVTRILKGALVIFCKSSVYNHMASTYDGRHNIMDSGGFRKHVEELKVKNKYNLEHKEELEEAEKAKKIVEDEYRKKNREIAIKRENDQKDLFDLYFKNFIFDLGEYSILDINSTESTRVYGIDIRIESYTFDFSSYRLKNDFYFRLNVETTGYRNSHIEVNSKDDAVFETIEDVKKAIFVIQKQIDGCPELSKKIFISILCQRIYAPRHLFNKDDLNKLLLSGDDSHCNMLVVDEDGYLNLIDPSKYNDYELFSYPVRNETYGAGNNYVGKYAPLTDLDDIYLSNLKWWSLHLATGESVNVDYYDRDKSEKELINEIDQLLASKIDVGVWKKRSDDIR